MLNEVSQSQKGLTVKDLVTTGIFSALFFLATMIGGGFFVSNPVLTFIFPLAAALVTGPVYLLLIAKVLKHGPIIILGVLMALLMFVTGMYWVWSIAYIVLSIIVDLISGIKKFKNMKLNIIGFMIFSLNSIGSYMMLWINQNKYIEYLISKGTDQNYMDTMVNSAKDWMLPAMIVGTLICAFLSALLGRKLLKKQFEKAGIVV